MRPPENPSVPFSEPWAKVEGGVLLPKFGDSPFQKPASVLSCFPRNQGSFHPTEETTPSCEPLFRPAGRFRFCSQLPTKTRALLSWTLSRLHVSISSSSGSLISICFNLLPSHRQKMFGVLSGSHVPQKANFKQPTDRWANHHLSGQLSSSYPWVGVTFKGETFGAQYFPAFMSDLSLAWSITYACNHTS